MEQNIAKVLKLGIAVFFRKWNYHKMEENIAKVVKLGISTFAFLSISECLISD
jgi:hypothetical protein